MNKIEIPDCYEYGNRIEIYLKPEIKKEICTDIYSINYVLNEFHKAGIKL